MYITRDSRTEIKILRITAFFFPFFFCRPLNDSESAAAAVIQLLDAPSAVRVSVKLFYVVRGIVSDRVVANLRILTEYGHVFGLSPETVP